MIEFSGRYANHLSHALTALCFLGAPKEKLRDYYDSYTSRVELEPPLPKMHQKVDEKNWENFLGNHQVYTSFVDFFTKELKNDTPGKIGLRTL